MTDLSNDPNEIEPTPAQPQEPTPTATKSAATPSAATPSGPTEPPEVPTASSADASDTTTIGSTPASSFSPAPDHVDRGRVAFDAPTQPTPETWFEPAAAGGAPARVEPKAHRRAGGILVPVLAAALISATLASGGTYLAFRASGALDTRVATAQTPAGQTASAPQPVTVDENSAIINVAAKVSPAVVRIVSSANVNTTDPTSLPSEGVGSGIIYDKNGWILTNRHVVAGSDKLVVQLKDGREFDGTIYGIDTLTDLAIVKVDATELPTAAIGDSAALKVGQTTIAIGSPLGTYTNTVTSGILSASGRSIEVDNGRINNLLQTDTAINPGNSGGPLLDIGGNVIGINTAIAANANGIGFAIPINIARPIMEQALAGEKLARPYLGVFYQMLDLKTAAEFKLSVHEGAYVHADQTANGQAQDAVKAGGPADKAGIKDGDIITSIEGQTLDSEHPLDAILTQFAPGKTVTLEILRNGETITVQVTLGVRPADL